MSLWTNPLTFETRDEDSPGILVTVRGEIAADQNVWHEECEYLLSRPKWCTWRIVYKKIGFLPGWLYFNLNLVLYTKDVLLLLDDICRRSMALIHQDKGSEAILGNFWMWSPCYV